MQEPRFKTVFASAIHCVVDKERDEFLSTASINDLKNIIPAEVLGSGKEDLLPFSSNLAVLNAMNANFHCMTAETGLEIHKSLVNKYVNLQHRRDHVLGHIVATSFSRFSPKYVLGYGSEILAEADIKDNKNPVNLSYAGVIYKIVAGEELCDKIIESNDPNSPYYLKGISSSWEVGYDAYNIAIGGKYLKDAEIITPEDKSFKELDKLLRDNGGPGTKNGENLYTVLAGRPIFLGAGIVENPASDVAGVIVASEEDNDQRESKATITVDIDLNLEKANDQIADFINDLEQKRAEIIEKVKAIAETTPNPAESSVIKDSNTTILYMEKIKDIKDITDENLKVIKADKITEFITDELRKASESFTVQITEKDNVLKTTKEQLTSLSAEHDTLKKNLETLTAELNTLKTQAAERELNEIFSSRMANLDEKFDLTDEDRQIIASQIKNLDEAGFAAWEKNMSILMKDKSKAARKTSVASTATPQGAVDAAIDNGTKAPAIPNTSNNIQSESFAEKVKKDPKLAYSIKLGKK